MADNIVQTEISQISDFECEISNDRLARPMIIG